MAKGLFQVKRNDPHPDLNIRATQFEPGMCITLLEDGQDFGPGDLEGHARVIEFPGLTVADLFDLVEPLADMEELVDPLGNVTKRLKIHAVRARKAKALNLLGNQIAITKAQAKAFIAANFDDIPKPLLNNIIQ